VKSPTRWLFAGAIALASSALIAPTVHGQRSDSSTVARGHPRRTWVLGAVTSLLAHEAAHVVSSYAMGATPRFAFDPQWRPTVYSGIDPDTARTKQLIFSSAGLAVQAGIDEWVLDVPAARSSAFGRGMVACGLGTAFFYVTLGRNANVSDITLMARTSSLSKNEVSLIVGGVATMHAVRFFQHRSSSVYVEPGPDGRLRVGMRRDGPLWLP
jgi:hypothetical protein